MAGKGAAESVVPAGRLSKDAVRALQTGLGAWTLLFLTFSTFGPWFNLGLSYALVLCALLLGLVTLVLADRGYHSVSRDPGSRGVRHSAFAVVLGLPAVVVAGGYVGLHIAFLFVFPIGLMFLLMTLAVLFTIVSERTSARARGESFFRFWFDAPTRSSACGRCGRRTSLAVGKWIWDGWLCSTCHASFPGGSA